MSLECPRCKANDNEFSPGDTICIDCRNEFKIKHFKAKIGYETGLSLEKRVELLEKIVFSSF